MTRRIDWSNRAAMFLVFALSSLVFTTNFQPLTPGFEAYQKRSEVIKQLQSDIEEVVASKTLSSLEVQQKALAKVREAEAQLAQEKAYLSFDRGGQAPFNTDSLGADTTSQTTCLTARERSELFAKLEPRLTAEDFTQLKEFFAQSQAGFSSLAAPSELATNKISFSRDLSDRTLNRAYAGIFSLNEVIERLGVKSPESRDAREKQKVKDSSLISAQQQIRAELLQAKLNPEDYILVLTPAMFYADKLSNYIPDTSFVFESDQKLVITRTRERSDIAVPFAVKDCAIYPRKVWIFKKSDFPTLAKTAKSKSVIEISIVDENIFPR